MTMKIGKVLNAVVFGLLLGCCQPVSRVLNLTVGPKPHEKGTYVYTIDGSNTQHCMWCPEGAFDNTEANLRTQQPKCIMKYTNISQEIKPFELENNKIPLCKVGEVPGCGEPPGEKKTRDLTWSCDPGCSNVYHSVYFSCALIHEKSRVVAFSYYCNESLLWQLDFSNPENTTRLSTEPSYSGTFKLVWIVASTFGTCVCIALVVCAVWICQKRRRVNSRNNDPESSAFLSVIGEGNNNGSCQKGNRKSVTSSSISGSDITEGSEKNEKNERTRERQPPYGAENPCSLNSSFKSTDTASSCHSQRNTENIGTEACTHSCHSQRCMGNNDAESCTHSSHSQRCMGNNGAESCTHSCHSQRCMGNNGAESCTHSCHSQRRIEDNGSEVCTGLSPQSVHSSQLRQNCEQLSGQNLIHPDRYDDLKTVNNNQLDQSTDTGPVRAELQHSLLSNERRCQCLLFRKPLNKPELNRNSSFSTGKVPSHNLKVSEIHNHARQKDGCLANGSINERPNPQGKVSRQRNFECGRDVSINTYIESGYFDDENDERHNTMLKEVFRNGTDARFRECSAGGEMGLQSRLDQKCANLPIDSNEAQCVYRSTDETNDLSYEIDNDDLKKLNTDNDDSVDKTSAP